MVRIRAYTFTLSLPLLIILGGFLIGTFTDDIGGLNSFWIGFGSFAFGFVLQAIFSLAFACPRCGKSPYAIGPFRGPYGVAGKPFPDRVCSNCGYNLAEREDAT